MQIIIIFSFAFCGTLLAAEAHTALIPGPDPGSSSIIEKGVALGQFPTLRTPRTIFCRGLCHTPFQLFQPGVDSETANQIIF